ncbi:MAG: hypothetical protein JWQ90_4267 [Hydrocarboniphaga sp.]|uniref:alpha/beta hydrolase family esterase n=1 Tax=Hydrocarboniphaga sp. TaxID=2033016 RepID=UPI00262ADA1E|nr:PHB depolymerase family esterase [Hydrocarboniphaga sp.]MDB5971817.1 hypothetical protein [Hydrocarboniphaga sp.]
MKFSIARWVALGSLSLCSFGGYASNLVTEIYGGVVSTVSNVIGTVTDPFAGVLVGVTQIAPEFVQHTVIRIQGRTLELVPGTAAFDLTVTHNGNSRTIIVVRPEPATTGVAAVVMLHGNGGTPQNQANLAEIAPQVAARGLWVFLPAAVNGVWDDDPANSDPSKDDVGFISRVIDIAVTGYGLDPDRVYAAGLSNGGFMSQRLSCELSDRLAAVGVVSAALRNGLAGSCTTGLPRPITLIVGTSDPIVPYGGIGNIRSADNTLAFWAQRNGCDTSAAVVTDLPDSTADGTTVQRIVNETCGSGKEVARYAVTGGGHAWPGGWQYLPIPLIGTTSTDIDATSILFDFFARYTR